jgi:hypothetical protein
MGMAVVSLRIEVMNITFTCPKCDADVRTEVPPSAAEFACPACRANLSVPSGAFEGTALTRCLVCASTELFVRKDFPQRVGVGIVVLGFALSSVAWAYMLPIWTFAILFATALIDLMLYTLVPDALMCYRCGAQYRRAEGLDLHGPFDLETHERHRQQKARQQQVRHQADGQASVAASASSTDVPERTTAQ